MKKILLLLAITLFGKIASAQSFALPGDGNWYRVATMGGGHAHLKYLYSQETPHNPSITSGEIDFINSVNGMVQHHQTTGYSAWNQPQFALINYGDRGDLWVKATNGVMTGAFRVVSASAGNLTLGDIHDNNLADNGGVLTVYDKLKDNANIFYGNVIVPTGRMAIGTNNIDPNYTLAVKGNIHATQVNVDTDTWPDYVFEKGYKFHSLPDIEKYIKQNGHLPDMPSANEVKLNGIDLGDTNARLLKKIEELTLYLIDLKKENEKHKGVEQRMAELENQVKLLSNKGQ